MPLKLQTGGSSHCGQDGLHCSGWLGGPGGLGGHSGYGGQDGHGGQPG